jgi:hypothetical protein
MELWNRFLRFFSADPFDSAWSKQSAHSEAPKSLEMMVHMTHCAFHLPGNMVLLLIAAWVYTAPHHLDTS